MYYRVRKSKFKHFIFKTFKVQKITLYVLDEDVEQLSLESRINIDCAGLGPKSFSSPIIKKSQDVYCIDQGSKPIKSDIIEAP
jgi:hypothetical protein